MPGQGSACSLAGVGRAHNKTGRVAPILTKGGHMKLCIYGASSRTIDEKYIKATEELCEIAAKRGHTLVFGGGAGGLMGAAARGFERGGAKEIICVAPSFFNVDGVLFERCSEYIYPDTMRERKGIMEEKSDAFIAVPGGIGTFDEFFEIITLRSLARHSKPVAVFNSFGFYNPLLDMLEKCEKEGFVNLSGGNLFGAFENAEELLDYIENGGGEVLCPASFKNV